MKMYLLLMAFILQDLHTKAQGKDIEIVHAGDNLSDHFTYRFPSFTNATILFKNGTLSIAKMNFNMFLCKMQFIESTGDTLVVSKPEGIDSIRLNDRSFFYNRGYFEIISVSDSFKLAVLRKINIDVVVKGALGISTHTANVESYDSYLSFVGPKKFLFNDDIAVKKEAIYSLIGKNGVIVTASKSGFLKMFANDKKSIDNFLKLNKINFNSQDDLEKLFLFCIQPKV